MNALVPSVGYHTNAAFGAALQALVGASGGRAVLESAGTTVRGQAIPLVRIGRGGDRPAVLVTANVHGNEVIASEVALGVLETLLAADPSAEATALTEGAEILVLPAVNLDSREIAAEALADGRPWARTARGNANGVDLNRNFPFCAGARDAWHPLAGTTRAWLPWYRGPSALSEPESRALATLAERTRPIAALNLHSAGGLFLHPYCHTAKEPSAKEDFLAMGRAFRAAQPARPYDVKQAKSWYTILGDMDDWLYDTFGTLAVTAEISRPAENIRNPRHLLGSLGWLNPPSPGPARVATVGACLAALAAGIAIPVDSAPRSG